MSTGRLEIGTWSCALRTRPAPGCTGLYSSAVDYFFINLVALDSRLLEEIEGFDWICENVVPVSGMWKVVKVAENESRRKWEVLVKILTKMTQEQKKMKVSTISVKPKTAMSPLERDPEKPKHFTT